MLKIKTAFLCFFVFFALSFAFVFYSFTNSYLNFLLLKQYEQKIKTLNDALVFGLLNKINAQNIKEFAQATRADFLIKHKDEIISSLEEYDFLKKLKENEIAVLNSKKILIKNFSYEEFSYTIIVYPRFLDLENFWITMSLFFGIYLVFIIFFIYIFTQKFFIRFKNIFEFLNQINNHQQIVLKKSFFKELNLLNATLLKIKQKNLKILQKNKKQHDKISLKNTQLSNVISAISHELKNPLSVIDLSLEMLKDKSLNSKFHDELLEKISRQSHKLNELTYKLNFVFNLNDENLQMQQFNLYALCEKIIQNPGFERVALQGEKSFVNADKFLIEQVIINLLSNALKYSDKEVILKVFDTGICVKDFGKGIEKNKIKLITKKFYKINAKSENSFGLGLFLVKKILTLHKSYLEILSVENEGSEFSFRL